MKKILSLVLVSVMAVNLAGCGTEKEPEIDEYGNEIVVTDTTYTVYPKELPYTIDCSGEPLELTDILFYQGGGDDSTYYYYFYVLALFDVSGLSSRNLNHLEIYTHPTVHITSEENELDDTLGRTLGYMQIEDTDTLVYVFAPPDHNSMHDFAGAEVRLDFPIDEVEGEYETVEVVYSDTAPEDIPSDSEIMTDFSWDLTVAILGWEFN